MSSRDEPTFSVVIPTYGRPDRLARCLGALAKLDPPAGGFEVIVVDDGSPDRLDAVVADYSRTLAIRLCRKRNGGPASARNLGARIARGRWLAFLDDDCVPKPGWLRGFEPILANTTCRAAGGLVASGPGDTIFSIASNRLLAYLYDYYNRPDREGSFYATANLACSKRTFIEMGGFDETFRIAAAEDRDFCERLAETGRTIVFAADAEVDHAPRLSLRRFIRQHFNYGRGAHHLQRARYRRGRARRRIEPIAFYSGLLGSAFAEPVGHGRLRVLLLLMLTQVMYVMGYVAERVTSKATSTE